MIIKYVTVVCVRETNILLTNLVQTNLTLIDENTSNRCGHPYEQHATRRLPDSPDAIWFIFH